MENNYDARIDEMYILHDNSELVGKSNFYINEHPEVVFPHEDSPQKKNITLDALIKIN